MTEEMIACFFIGGILVIMSFILGLVFGSHSTVQERDVITGKEILIGEDYYRAAKVGKQGVIREEAKGNA